MTQPFTQHYIGSGVPDRQTLTRNNAPPISISVFTGVYLPTWCRFACYRTTSLPPKAQEQDGIGGARMRFMSMINGSWGANNHIYAPRS